MIDAQSKGNRYILLSFVVALALTVLPLPDALSGFRPEWAALVLFYWIMALPYRIGIGVAWLLGICLDVLKGALLGQHVLALVVVTFLLLNMSLRVRVHPFWQQAVIVTVLLFIYHALLFWIYDMTGTIKFNWQYWVSALVGGLFWPWIFTLLRGVRRHYQVS